MSLFDEYIKSIMNYLKERVRESHRAMRVMKEMCELIEEIKLTCNSFLIIIS